MKEEDEDDDVGEGSRGTDEVEASGEVAGAKDTGDAVREMRATGAARTRDPWGAAESMERRVAVGDSRSEPPVEGRGTAMESAEGANGMMASWVSDCGGS